MSFSHHSGGMKRRRICLPWQYHRMPLPLLSQASASPLPASHLSLGSCRSDLFTQSKCLRNKCSELPASGYQQAVTFIQSFHCILACFPSSPHHTLGSKQTPACTVTTWTSVCPWRPTQVAWAAWIRWQDRSAWPQWPPCLRRGCPPWVPSRWAPKEKQPSGSGHAFCLLPHQMYLSMYLTLTAHSHVYFEECFSPFTCVSDINKNLC